MHIYLNYTTCDTREFDGKKIDIFANTLTLCFNKGKNKEGNFFYFEKKQWLFILKLMKRVRFCTYFRNYLSTYRWETHFYYKTHQKIYSKVAVAQKRPHRKLKNQQKIRHMPDFCYTSADLKIIPNCSALLESALLSISGAY